MSSARVVSIGMTHPQNVAGIGLDARIAAEYGVRHAIVVAAVSAQDEAGVHSVFPLPSEIVLKQIQAARICDDDILRIGALGSAANADLVAQCHCDEVTVFDPVMRASSGGSLYVDDPTAALRVLLDTDVIVTPNIEEAKHLTGIAIGGVPEMTAAGKQLIEKGASAALIKGGHLPGEAIDVLVTDDDVEIFAGTRLPREMRGTGCMLAMSLACELALGRDLVPAIQNARAYVRGKLQVAF